MRIPFRIFNFCIIPALLSVNSLSGQINESEVQRAVKAQLHLYPASTLQDIYKSFFQDEFGPGHLLEDTVGARQYFEYELSGMESRGRRQAEPCGTGRNFYRVPMDLVKDGIIPAGEYFSAFLESSAGFRVPEAEVWKMKWDRIEKEIAGMKLNLPGYNEDKKSISDLLDAGEAAVHHSRPYVEEYDPHYRIIGTEQWKKLAKTHSLL